MPQNKEKRWVRVFIISTFVALYAVVSLISTIHVIDFFRLSNADWLAISLAVGFEIGAAASLASLIALQKMNKSIVWVLFFTLTAMQAMGNTYYAYSHLKDFTQWSELFGLNEEELIYQKRFLSIISGAILPLVALGFIKSLVDYIKPEEEEEQKPVIPEPQVVTVIKEVPVEKIQVQEVVEETKTESKAKPTKKVIPEVIQTGYKAGSLDEPIDLGSSEPQEDEETPGKKKSIWHRVFNNDSGPENLK